MPPSDEEVQLEQTKMSFGEHLEELRRAVFKSLLALVIGFIVGLCIGIPLVDYIQGPLRRALLEYKYNRAVARQLAWFESQAAAGEDVPDDLQAAAEEAVRLGGIPHEYLISTDELAAVIEDRLPDLAQALRAEPAATPTPDSAAPPSSQAGDADARMLRLRLYEPLEDEERLNAIATDTFEPMVVYLKASFAAGVVLASPFIFYYIWEFVAAGLYKSERRYVHIYLPFSLGLFLVGAALAYYFALEYMLRFLFWFHEKMGIDPYPKLSDWITTVVLMPLGFGVSFQLPLVMLLLERIGVFTVEAYVAKWRIAVVVIAVMSMILTPGSDVSSMLLMFVPLTGLYFLGIWLCRHMPGGPLASPLRRHPPKGAPPSRPEDSTGS